MPNNWEEQFRIWASPPGITETNRCENAINAVKNALSRSQKLQHRDITVFLQGSYLNNTNVRNDSDVDIGVLCTNSFYYDALPGGLTPEILGFKTPANYTFSVFKNEIEQALSNYFGNNAVTRGKKAFDLHETSYHVDADVTPFFEHRRYSVNTTYIEGVELRPDGHNERVINWPEQHYSNGCQKNKDTGRRYKSVVRILKALSNEMEERGIQNGNIPSFLIECLVWNVPDDHFQCTHLTDDVRNSLIYLFKNTNEDNTCVEWGEVSELKYLFRPSQKWTRAEANDFVLSAWNYVGFRG